MAKGEQRIEYVALGELQRAVRNPKLHRHDVIEDSVKRHGFIQPPLIDESTGRLVAGHGRIETLHNMQVSHAGNPAYEPPGFVKVREDGEWLVPVLRGIAFESEREAEEFLLADNRSSEIGGWDDSVLSASLQSVGNVSLLGWSDVEISAIHERVNANSLLDTVIGEAGVEVSADTPVKASDDGEHVTITFTLTPEQNAMVFKLLRELKRVRGARTNSEAFVAMCVSAFEEVSREGNQKPVSG